MRRRSRIPYLLIAAIVIPASVSFAQRFGGGAGGGTIYVPPGTKTQREVNSRSIGVPEWTNPKAFERDVFTFARLRTDREGFFGYGRRGGDWTTDLPDADLSLSYRLQQMTALKVDPNGRIVRATDPELFKFPFLWHSAPHNMALNEEETLALRKYLLNGGFLLVDDFWGDSEWQGFEGVMRRVLPDLRFEELPITHPLYRSVFKIDAKYQVPNIGQGTGLEGTGAWEYDPRATAEQGRHDGDVFTVHHRAIFDSKGRLIVLALHNTDTGDGWEREGESDYYFHRFAEKVSYPLGINILFYVMTH